jgi:hypothetical protein
MGNSSTTLRNSVSCRISCHSGIAWAVRRWPILNKREFSKPSSSILNFMLILIEARCFNMKIQEIKINGLSEIRFRSMIFLFRLAGIRFQMKEISTIYTMYMVTVILCSLSTFIDTFVDVYLHRDDLGRAMTTMRVTIPITNIMWIFSYCR